MNKLHNFFLHLLKHSLTGTHIETSESLSLADWHELVSLAEAHKVLPLIYEASHQALNAADPAYAHQIRSKVLQQVMVQTMKTEDFLELNRKLQEAGIKPLVVKGIICRNLYPKPDLRMSGDEDVLIENSQFEKCHSVLNEAGMQTTDDEHTFNTSYEVSYRKENSPLYIELHKHLFSTKDSIYSDWNRFFEDAFERAVPEEIQGVTVWSLDYTDHLFYLICHAFKHFLHSGFGVRQVCDIVMYANAYGNQINWCQLIENCKSIKAELFTVAIFKIGSSYLNFDADKACYPKEWRAIEVDEQPLLEDLLSAGIYGGIDMSRKHSSNMTLNAVAEQKKGKAKGHAILRTLFPSAKNLMGRYPYLQTKKYLLPIAWADRILKYRKETAGQKDNSAADAIRIGNQRIELLKKYGVLDE